MSLSFPLSVADLCDRFNVVDVTFTLDWPQQLSGDGNGEIYGANLAPGKWMAEFRTAPLSHLEAKGVMARINSLQGTIKTFYAYDFALPYPSVDPTGSIMSGADGILSDGVWSGGYWIDTLPWGSGEEHSPVVDTVVDALHLSISKLPARYSLKTGEYLSIEFGSPSRKYLGQFVEDGVADASGDLASIEVIPPLPAGVTAADAVTLIKPPAKFKMMPGTAYPSITNLKYETIKFSAQQTYGAG